MLYDMIVYWLWEACFSEGSAFEFIIFGYIGVWGAMEQTSFNVMDLLWSAHTFPNHWNSHDFI